MLFRKKNKKPAFDPKEKKPVIRCSICTDEKAAGFRDLKSGKFHEVMLIRDQRDLKSFKDEYGIEGDIEEIY